MRFYGPVLLDTTLTWALSQIQKPLLGLRLAHRTVLSGVLASSELYLLTDNSPGHGDTWAAVDRAVGEALKLLGSSDAVGGALGGLRDKAYATILDVMASRRG